MEQKQILTLGGGILATIIFLYASFMLTSKPQIEYFPELTSISKDDHVKWTTDGDNTFVEYSDYQCPACGAYTALLKELESDSDFADSIMSKTKFVYRDFPLDSIHVNARMAAQGAEAAGNQGKYFLMHDQLFTNQQEWSESDNPLELFKEYAKEIGLDIDQFKADFSSKETKDKVQADYTSGLGFGVKGTPTFYMNGKKLETPNSAEKFKELLKSEVQAKI